MGKLESSGGGGKRGVGWGVLGRSEARQPKCVAERVCFQSVLLIRATGPPPGLPLGRLNEMRDSHYSLRGFSPTCTRGGLMGCESVSVHLVISMREGVSTGAGVMKSSMTQVQHCASSRGKFLVIGKQTNTRWLKADGTVPRGSGQQSTRTLYEADTWQLYKRLRICDMRVRQRASLHFILNV